MDYGLQIEDWWPDQLECVIASADWIRAVYIVQYDLVMLDIFGCLDSELL